MSLELLILADQGDVAEVFILSQTVESLTDVLLVLVPIQPKILHFVSVGDYLFPSFLSRTSNPVGICKALTWFDGNYQWTLQLTPMLLAIRKSLASAFGRQVPCWGEGNSSPALCWALRPHCGPRSLLPRGEQLLY